MTPREEYVNAIVTENKAYGLTGLKTAAEVDRELYEDALAFFRPGQGRRGPWWISGRAGIPRDPDRLSDETLEVTLVEDVATQGPVPRPYGRAAPSPPPCAA